MKKLLLFITIALLGTALKAQEKSFQKGKIIISVGANLGVYGTKTHQEQDKSVLISGAVQTVRTVKDTTGGAGSGVFPLTIEYGITNWLGVGARFGYSKYIAKADSANKNTKPTVIGLDGDLVLSLHFIKTVHFDMPLEFVAGYSHLNYMSNDQNGSAAKSGGLNYGFALVPHIYFGKHVGMFFNLGYSGTVIPILFFPTIQAPISMPIQGI